MPLAERFEMSIVDEDRSADPHCSEFTCLDKLSNPVIGEPGNRHRVSDPYRQWLEIHGSTPFVAADTKFRSKYARAIGTV